MAASERVVIGMDPRKRSVTIEVMTADETVVGGDRSGGLAALRHLRRGQRRRVRPVVELIQCPDLPGAVHLD